MNDIAWTFHFIPQDRMTNGQCGDYECHGRTIDFYITATEDWRYAALVSLHEMIEVILTRHAGIDEKDITAYDREFFAHSRKGEPGDAHDSPYREQHQTASAIERVMAYHLEVNWDEYNKELDRIVEGDHA